MYSKGILTIVLIWVALTIFFAAIGVVALDWRQCHALAQRGVEVEGKVIAKEPENHRLIRYSYVAGAETYFALGTGGDGNPEFEQLNTGDRVKVFYDPGNPKESILGNPQRQASSKTTGVLFLAIIAPLFSIVGLYRKGWLPIFKPHRI
jgi:hypothetical protein